MAAPLHHWPAGGSALRRGGPDGATPREPTYHHERERHWSDGARPEGGGRPQHKEEARERPTPHACREYCHAGSHAPAPGRSYADWRHLCDGESRRGEEEPKHEWRPRPPERRAAPAEHRGHDEQPRYAAPCHEGRGLFNPDHQLGRGFSNPRHRLAPPRAGGAPRLTGDAAGAWRASPRELLTGHKRGRDLECERDREWVARREPERERGWNREQHDERRHPAERRDDHGKMHAFGTHAGHRDSTAVAVRSDPRSNNEYRVDSVGGGERGRSQADHHRTPPLTLTTTARFASAPPERAPLRANAAADGAREPGLLELKKQLNQRLVQARGAGELLRLHAEHGGSFNNVNLATCWSRLGRVGCGQGFYRQLEALRDQTLTRLHSWEARHLTNLAHALGKLEVCGDAWSRLWEAVAQASLRRCRKLEPQGLATTAWAFAKAGHAASELFDAIAAEAAPRVREFKPQELANTVWAYATAGHAAPVLLNAIAAEAAPRVRDFNPQNLANTAWAYAKAGHAAPVLLIAIVAEASPRLGEFNPQDLVNTAWAYAKAGHTAPALLNAIAAEAAPRVREFNSQALANTAWAYVTAGHAAPLLLNAIAAEAAPRVREFNPQALANTAWAYATAGHAAPALLDAIAAEAAPRLGEFNPQNLCITAWAFAAANRPIDGSGLFGQRFASRCEELAAELGNDEMSQLQQWRLWHSGERGCSNGLPSDALLERCRTALASQDGQPSGLQRQVGETLTSLGLFPAEEVVLHEGYSLDFVVEWGGERLGIEVDGPSHFVGREPNGATLLKRRQLRHLGWRLLSVPYWEWDTAQHRSDYMTSALDTA